MSDYRIDELAQVTGTTVRNIRAYRERGLIPPPRRDGRITLYDDSHVARLRLLSTLLDRGYTFSNIAELIEAWESGHSLGDRLGLEDALVAPSSDETPAVMTTAELGAMFGGEVNARAIERAVELGVLTPDAGDYRVVNPRLLRIAADLVAAGIPTMAVVEHGHILHADIDKVAREFVDLAYHHVFAAFAEQGIDQLDVPRVTELIQRLKPLARMVVDAELARCMEAQIADRLREVLEQLSVQATPTPDT